MGEVRVHEVLDATPAEVWSVLSDVAGWASWNDVMVDARCDRGEVGAVLSCKVALGPIWFPVRSRLTAWTTEHTLVWGEDRGRALRIHHGFELQPDGEGTRVEHFERFEGALGRLVYPAVRGTLTENYGQFLASLKRRVEQG